jgi:hypothetical protein
MAFSNFAPWLATQPISETPTEALATLPKNCPAFSVNHGAFICEWHDTRERNPVGFWLNAGLLASCWGFIVFTGFTGRGFQINNRGIGIRRSQGNG